MPDAAPAVIIGGTSGIGLEIARHFAAQGRDVVLSGRDAGRAQAVAAELGGGARGIGVDLAEPETIRERLADVGDVEHLVLVAIDRDDNRVRAYDVTSALRLVTLKLVGYSAVVHALAPRLGTGSSVVVFGGQAKERPYPGSTTVSTINAGVDGLVRTLAVELAPVRVNAIHPGIVGDSPAWRSRPEAVLEGIRSRTPTGRLVQMGDIVDAVVFLLTNLSTNGISLAVDGGWTLL